MVRQVLYSVRHWLRRTRTRFPLQIAIHLLVKLRLSIQGPLCLPLQLQSFPFTNSLAWCSHAIISGAGTSPGLYNHKPASLGSLCITGQEWSPWRCSVRQCQSCATPRWYMIVPQLASLWLCIRIPVSSYSCDWSSASCTNGWSVFYQRLVLPLRQHATLKLTYHT